ncbi:MAG: polysaccharide biosynthesis/export family protein [Bacteroidales bacterium]|nr:polysaccharide biosynthesis/export family protein [Bacteroidales bacterium]
MKKYNTRVVLLVAALLVMTLTGCGTVEEYVLLNDWNTDLTYKMPDHKDLKIKPGDDLRIIVSQKEERIAAQFAQNSTLNDPKSYSNYTVNYDGNINFPMLDTVRAVGLTCTELEHHIKELIEDAGLAVEPSVNVKITNFKVTVIGESGTGVYTFDNPNVTLFDLLAQANLVANGGNGANSIRRDKILIMREVNGTLRSEYVNLLTKDVIYSPYFYLQQNDVVYVYPSNYAIRNSNKMVDFWLGRLSIITTGVSVITLVITLIQSSKGSNGN